MDFVEQPYFSRSSVEISRFIQDIADASGASVQANSIVEPVHVADKQIDPEPETGGNSLTYVTCVKTFLDEYLKLSSTVLQLISQGCWVCTQLRSR